MGWDGKGPPLVSFVTWNRLGLTVRNLSALLKTTDDFELQITDSNSTDDTWDYIQSLNDRRIKAITRLSINRGPIYAVNYNLSKRKKDQYFIALDSDVNIHTNGWTGKFFEVFDAFPDAGLLGTVSREYYERYRHPLIKHEKGHVYYLEITKGFIEGCMQCFRPGLLDILGYWCEECCMGDVEICNRICKHTCYKAGYLPLVEIDLLQRVKCDNCNETQFCRLYGKQKTCFDLRDEKYKNPQFRKLYGWKHNKCAGDMENGIRSAYRASVHNRESMKQHDYNRHLADENFKFYEKNAN